MTSSLEPLFRPDSIAVVGASRSPGTIGHQILHNLVTHGYQGALYPVNPHARSVHSIPAYPSVGAVPDPVELAVVVVPKDRVLEVVEECGRKGVKGLVVISAGFREVGPHGEEKEKRLVARTQAHGMRLVGPNCMGLLNTDLRWSMNATFAPTMPPSGPVSFLSQSGALGVTILDYAAELGLGIRNFISVGNKADVSGNDLLEFWEEDPETRVVLMYLENFGNPRKFTRIARRVSRRKPIVVVKSGRSAAGARAASSHTGALAGADSTIDALLGQCGVLRANTVQELFDFSMAFASSRPPEGNRVAVVTNAGGPGIILADACEARGLRVPPLSEGIQDRLRDVLPEEASVRNPVDLVASATAESYQVALELVLQDGEVDAVIAAFVPPLGVLQVDVAQAIVDAGGGSSSKPVLAVLMGREGLPEGRNRLRDAGVPAYIFPESAARSLAALHRYRRWLDRPVEEPRRFQVDSHAVREILDEVQGEGRSHLTEPEGLAVLHAYGIPVVPHEVVGSEEEATAAAERLGLPAVVKLLSPGVIHKTDVGGVHLDLGEPEAVARAFREVASAAETRGLSVQGALVASHLADGHEAVVGMAWDPVFGPVLMVGLGGILVEALGDVAFGVHPVTEVDAREMLASLRGRSLLEGARGRPPVDLEALLEVIQRVSQLVGDHHRIRELDVNPLLVRPDGAVAVDALVAVAPPAAR